MGRLLVLVAGAVVEGQNNPPFELEGTLPNGTASLVTHIDLGSTVREHNWLENWSRAKPVMTATQVRKTEMSITVTLRASSPLNLVRDARVVRNAFMVSNLITYSLDYPALSEQYIETYPSAIPPLLNAQDEMELAVMRTQSVKLDWRLPIWRNPSFQGQSTTIVG